MNDITFLTVHDSETALTQADFSAELAQQAVDLVDSISPALALDGRVSTLVARLSRQLQFAHHLEDGDDRINALVQAAMLICRLRTLFNDYDQFGTGGLMAAENLKPKEA